MTRDRHNADWIAIKELQQLTGWSRRTVFNKQDNGELKTRLAEPAANGKRRREYDASALPAELQAKRMQQALARSVPIGPRNEPRVVRPLGVLDEHTQDQARERLDIIRPMLDFLGSGQGPLCPDGERVTNLSGIVKHVAATRGVSERTLWNWWNAYKQGGLGALADKPRRDRNVSRFFNNREEAAQFAANKFINERLSIAMVHEALLSEWDRLRPSSDDAPPSYETTRLYLQRGISPLVKIVAREGERAYNEKAAPFLIRKIEATRVNEYWISDHMIHDVWVRNDGVFGELGKNEAFRPWLTGITDMKSRRVVGTAWCVNPSSNTISSALRFGLRHYGRPECFYVDNGKDFRRLGKGAPAIPAPSEDAAGVLVSLGVLLRLGIQPQHCLPMHPQSKQIESFFRTVHQRFDVLWKDAYCGTSALARPEECDVILREHKRLLKQGRGDQSPLPPASRFIQAACYWLDEFNRTFRHSGQGMKGRTPQEVFDAELPPERRTVVDIKAIAPLFWSYQDRVVKEGGCVEIFNARYEPADAESAAALMLSVTLKINIACDPLNLGEAIAFDHAGKFLGHLRAQELMIHGETREEDIRASMRERRKFYRAVKTYQSALERSRELAGDVTVLESLERRAARSAVKPTIHALPVPKAVGAVVSAPRLHVDDIADGYFEEN